MLVRKNLRGRYKASVLGFAWTFVNPLLQLCVYTVVFSVIMRNNIEKYSLFLFVGLVPWIAFSSSLTDGSVAVVKEQALVTKIYFPRQILPIVTTLNNFVNMFLCMIVVVLVCLCFNGINVPVLLYLLPVSIIEFILALSISFIVSSLTVYFRDLQHILGIVVMAWQFLTPVMYSMDMVPEKYKAYFYLNPMTHIIEAYRDILYYKTVPDFMTMVSAVAIGLCSGIAGWVIFEKLQRKFAEVL